MEHEQLRRRDLPHWDVPGAAYFVTSCLQGSIPARGLLDLARRRADLRGRPKPEHLTAREWDAHRWKLGFARLERWLDGEPANRSLERPDLARVVESSMLHFAGERYDLLAYVVMPSHFHWVFQPRAEWCASLEEGRSARETIMYGLKRFTSNRCNRLLGRAGTFWQAESYDHWVRDGEELGRIIHYVEGNPVVAGLVSEAAQWRFSSAWARRQSGTEWGVPLSKVLSGSES